MPVRFLDPSQNITRGWLPQSAVSKEVSLEEVRRERRAAAFNLALGVYDGDVRLGPGTQRIHLRACREVLEVVDVVLVERLLEEHFGVRVSQRREQAHDVAPVLR